MNYKLNHVCLKIEGEYWDYLIKYNYLYLWTFDDELVIYDWKKIINSLMEKYPALVELNVFLDQTNNFLDKILFYNSNQMEILIDSQILNNCFISRKRFDVFTSIDSYYEKLIVNDDNGIHSLNLFDLIGETSAKFNKISDLPCFDIQTGIYGETIMAAGDEGIYFCEINRKSNKPKLKKLNNMQSNKVDWIKSNIYSTSPISNSFLMDIQQEKIYEEHKIFKNENYSRKNNNISWSSNNKIYKVLNHNTLEEVSIEINVQKEIEFKSRIIEFMDWKGEILNGKEASFGTVVECRHALVVIFKNKEYLNIPGEVIKWKIDIKNKIGKNILGVIFDDYINFYAFI